MAETFLIRLRHWAPPTCPLCLSGLTDLRNATDCRDCGVQYHVGCWHELGGCGTLGCRGRVTADPISLFPSGDAPWTRAHRFGVVLIAVAIALAAHLATLAPAAATGLPDAVVYCVGAFGLVVFALAVFVSQPG